MLFTICNNVKSKVFVRETKTNLPCTTKHYLASMYWFEWNISYKYLCTQTLLFKFNTFASCFYEVYLMTILTCFKKLKFMTTWIYEVNFLISTLNYLNLFVERNENSVLLKAWLSSTFSHDSKRQQNMRLTVWCSPESFTICRTVWDPSSVICSTSCCSTGISSSVASTLQSMTLCSFWQFVFLCFKNAFMSWNVVWHSPQINVSAPIMATITKGSSYLKKFEDRWVNK